MAEYLVGNLTKVVIMFSIGQMALFSMVSHLIFIYLAWKLMLAINFDPIIRKGKAKEAQVFFLLIAIVIGTGVSRFFLDILQWSSDLIYFF
ncbi:DUF1146 family protein [Virgibacillus halodenitrificans]|jgi:uncharacterized integral membrane protein (TIGR02327 family)|nr:DUF1146 family protein [Virgibacillus halodenitrificans]MCJ0929560.1 DUF1146 family protein [Virgibacillus halodenitrificans]